MYNCIIIRAGQTGLTRAIKLLHNSKKIKIIEKETIGGKITSSSRVENYPGFKSISGSELADNLYDQVTYLGGDVDIEEVLKINDGKIKEVVTDEGIYQTKTIIIATGTYYNVLGLENEDNFLGNGISFCTVCDGSFYKNKDVAVIGGGNSAIINAIYLSSICKTVYLVVRGMSLKGEKKFINELLTKDNVKILYKSEVIKYLGNDELDGIIVNNDNKEIKINVSGVFLSIGQNPETELFNGLIDLDNDNYINAGEECRTNVLGIFVAGDVRSKKIRQLTTAINDGTIAALNVIDYLSSNKDKE